MCPAENKHTRDVDLHYVKSLRPCVKSERRGNSASLFNDHSAPKLSIQVEALHKAAVTAVMTCEFVGANSTATETHGPTPPSCPITTRFSPPPHHPSARITYSTRQCPKDCSLITSLDC